MRLILLSDKYGSPRLANFSRIQLAVLAVLLLVGLLSVAAVGYFVAAQRYEALPADLLAHWRDELATMRNETASLQKLSGTERRAYATRLASLEARLVRLDALGEHLTEIAGLDDGEFDFSVDPAVGGPDEPLAATEPGEPALDQLIEHLDYKLADRERQLQILERLLANRKLQTETQVAGRPIRKGWMSSAYGRRTDPFHGGQAWHQGVDFAGKEGAEVIAVAAGVVTWSGERNGYGQLVEISHADGYATRYAHNRENLVEVGQVVQKGQVIARMGSSGRSTGPHVHFEVLRNGKAQNPASYVHRVSR